MFTGSSLDLLLFFVVYDSKLNIATMGSGTLKQQFSQFSLIL